MTMRLAPFIVVSLALAGCPKSGDSGPGPGSGPPTNPPPVTIDAAPAPPPVDAAEQTTPAAQHAPCSNAITCADGLTCVTYRGIAGNELASCEIPCQMKKPGCPSGQTCRRVADGPGEVCMEGGGGGTGGSGGSSGSGSSGGGGGTSLPKQTEPCPAGQCAAGLTCVEYYGIAGPRGPKFTSCEIPCKGGGACPKGQTCHTVADGPGQVCRP